MSQIESLEALLAPLFPGLMGVKLVDVTNERVAATLLVRPDLCTSGNTAFSRSASSGLFKAEINSLTN